MNVYDTANRLAYEIREAQEYKIYNKLKDSIMSNTEKKGKVEKFEKDRYEIQLLAMQGKEQNVERTKELEKEYVELVSDKEIKEYFEAEIKFNVMIADVNKIIAESVKDVL